MCIENIYRDIELRIRLSRDGIWPNDTLLIIIIIYCYYCIDLKLYALCCHMFCSWQENLHRWAESSVDRLRPVPAPNCRRHPTHKITPLNVMKYLRYSRKFVIVQ